MDRIKTGYALHGDINGENWFDPNLNYYVKNNFIDFYFKQNNILLKDIIQKIKFGAICLHNSWVPDFYKEMSLMEIFNDDLLISQLIRYALGNTFSESIE